ncbi:membrane protein insertase YidC [Robertmurraya yapensis]|uniref:Membrane protein insertase YidC n=1 Tax=Bacillus yapensis TaxID=2492960 RepID=A0A3S0JTP4_9BACI|nr:membrane protein insertase YidC [Bacillus yapensis]RTR28746.1 membrane protein insertase YidC [Bacillus yapensis]TKS94603.1 membrane protein insertase YidC [Bacillus yapensis]
MKHKLKLFIVILGTIFLSACSAQNGSDTGFFNTFFVSPFASAIHAIAELFHGNYGLSIICITLLIRLILMPLMLKQSKKQQEMKVKMEVLKPELEVIQKKIKATKDQQEQQKLQQEMFGLYKKHGVNPLSMGCLPMLIQMPILMGFYYAIRSSTEIASHSFLWFSLGQPDIILTAIAGIVYFLQFRVTMSNIPKEQQGQIKIMGLLSPVMIVIVSLNAPAALPLYWTVGGIFLIFQTWLARVLYKTPKAQAISK